MLSFSRNPILIYFFLVLVTIASWWFGRAGSIGHIVEAESYATLVVIFIIVVKVRFVILDFMEVRHAPLALRLILEIWVVIVLAMMLIFFGIY